eukprot:180137-Pelagomonas_calceolata.AAC.5
MGGMDVSMVGRIGAVVVSSGRPAGGQGGSSDGLGQSSGGDEDIQLPRTTDPSPTQTGCDVRAKQQAWAGREGAPSARQAYMAVTYAYKLCTFKRTSSGGQEVMQGGATGKGGRQLAVPGLT